MCSKNPDWLQFHFESAFCSVMVVIFLYLQQKIQQQQMFYTESIQ